MFLEVMVLKKKDFIKLERALIVLSKVHTKLVKFQERAFSYVSALSFILIGSLEKYRRYGFHYAVNIRDAVFELIPEFKPF